MEIRKTDVQKFFKRLRKINTEKLKYYAVGEYGGKTMRPHYHIILFNADIATIQLAWCLDNKPIGNVHYGEVGGASVGYTLKYMMKPTKIPMHKNDDRTKEFSLMSKRLGENYITPQMIDYHHADMTGRLCMTIEDGKKIAMPRYYKNKIYDENQRALIGAQLAPVTRLREEEKEAEMYRRYGDKYDHIKLENHKNQFTKMYKDAEKNRNGI